VVFIMGVSVKAKNTSYFEKLKDPRWQRKRLEVMERHNFECQECGDKEGQLNVHHPFYKKGAEPWEYEVLELMCLCDNCHKVAHLQEAKLDGLIHKIKSDSSLRAYWFNALIGYLIAVTHDGPFDIEFDNHEEGEGIRHYFGKHHTEFEKLAPNGVLKREIIEQWVKERPDFGNPIN
jgi:hypothetical protein